MWFTEGAEVSGMKACVGYIARLNRIQPLKAARDDTREHMACGKPMELESSMTTPYHKHKWEKHKQMDVKDKSYSYWSWYYSVEVLPPEGQAFLCLECPSHTLTRDNPSSWFILSDWKSIFFLLSYEPNRVPGFSGQDVSVDGYDMMTQVVAVLSHG